MSSTVFLRAPEDYSGGSLSIEGHQYPIEEVVDDPELGTCLFIEVEQAFADRAIAHGFTGCVPPVGRRRKPECFAPPVTIPASWEADRQTATMRRIMLHLVALGFGDARPPTRTDFEMAAAALDIPLDPVSGMPVADAPSGAEAAGGSAPAASPAQAPAPTGERKKTRAERRAERKAAQDGGGADAGSDAGDDPDDADNEEAGE